MHAPIKIAYRWTAEELLRARSVNFRHSCRRPYRVLMIIGICAAPIVGIWGLIIGREPVVSLVMIAIGVYFLVARSPIKGWLARREFRSRPDNGTEIEWEIDSNGLRSSSPLGQADFSWKAIGKAVRSSEGVLLYPNDRIYHWLPRSGFTSDHDFHRFWQIVQEQVGRAFNLA